MALWVRQGMFLSRSWTELNPRTEASQTLTFNALRFRLEAPQVLAVFMW